MVDNISFSGTCNEDGILSNCTCVHGWEGRFCEIMVNYCKNITCKNGGLCRPLLLTYKCECLSANYFGRECEIVGTKIVIYKIVSTSFAYVAIIVIIGFIIFIIIMDLLKYCFGIDPVHKERERIRRIKQAKKHKPVIQRFVYINEPSPTVTAENIV